VPDDIDKVTIITADGKQQQPKEEISLDKSSATTPAQLMALSVPRGHDYHLTLADGTQVWLNAESRLEFPDRFNNDTREVRLQGEAYFEVKKDAKRPFIVHSDYLTTRVLGTSFNVRAYSARDAAVTLVTGRVKVNAGETAQVLKPGQQASLTKLQLTVKDVDTYPVTQWKEGFFYFDNQTLFSIMQELARWYNVNVSFDDTNKMNVRLHFVVERSKSLKEAISNLNALGVAYVEIEGNVVVIN
jgi:ferric-dicitrate binding protein FerR (iron transport regulator)